MTADFSHLQALAVTRETTREYVFERIEGEPSVIVSPAQDDNVDYLNARLELTDELAAEAEARPRGDAVKISLEDRRKNYEDSRDWDRRLLAKACIRDWGTPPVDKAGKPVEFSEDNALAFLRALPDYMLDPFRGYTGNIYNFIPRKKPDGDKLGKS